MTADDKIVAVDLLYAFKNTLYLIQSGFDNSSPYNEHRPGNVLLYNVIKDAIESDLTSYDFLRGDENYKFRTSNKIRENIKLILQNKREDSTRRPIINEFFKKYADSKVKLSIEQRVLDVYLRRDNAMQGFSSYFKNRLNRFMKTINSN